MSVSKMTETLGCCEQERSNRQEIMRYFIVGCCLFFAMLLQFNPNHFQISPSSSIQITSPRTGIEACAPILVTDTEAALTANETASLNFIFSDKPTANAPLKQSPAPVESTVETF